MIPSLNRRTRSAVALGTTLTLAATLAACSAPSQGDGGTAEKQLTNRAEPAGTAEVSDVTWNLPLGEPTSIDPPNAATYSGAGVVSNLCDPLLKVDEAYNLTSNLATFEQVSPTQIVYTLAADATFWDGNPVTTEDVVYSLQRAAAPTSIVSFVFANVSSIEATSATQVTVNFTQPDVLFNPSMATFSGMVVEKAFAETAGQNFGTAASGVMCSGPYKFVSWTPGQSIEVTRNDNYWNKDLPMLVKNATFRFISDGSAATQALTAGEIDGSYQLDPASIPALQSASQGRLFYGPSMEQVTLNVSRPDGPLANIKLRDAFQTMIDRQAVADVVFNGAATPLYTLLTPRTWPNDFTDEYQAKYDEWAAKRAYDLDKAKQLVSESGYAGETLKLATTAGDETGNKIAQLVQQQAKQAGVNIELSELQPLEAAQAAYDPAVRQRLGLDFAIGASFNAAHEPLEPLGFTLLPGAPYNSTNLDDPSITSTLEQARQTLDDAERAKLTLQLQDLYEPYSTSIPIVSTDTVTFLNNRLGGAITSFAYLSMPALAYLGGTSN